MPERVLIENCAPTLAGMKTASLINVACSDVSDAYEETRRMNRVFRKKGIRVILLRYRAGRMLLYLYRPHLLQRDLEDREVRALLQSLGYSFDRPENGIAQLAMRMHKSASFPHEIGLFLGYPVADVKGFLNSRGNSGGCKYTGYWKVYGDVEDAKARFAKYRKCTDVYRRVWSKGRSIEDLTVRTGAC